MVAIACATPLQPEPPREMGRAEGALPSEWEVRQGRLGRAGTINRNGGRLQRQAPTHMLPMMPATA